MFLHADTYMCQICYAYVKVQDDLAQTQIHNENIILILRTRLKVIQRSGMYVTCRSKVLHASNIIWLCQRTKSCGPNTKPCQKQYILNFHVEYELRIRIMNLHVTLFYCDTPMCQIWYAIVKLKKSRNGQKYAHKGIQTDKQPTSYIPPVIPPQGEV